MEAGKIVAVFFLPLCFFVAVFLPVICAIVIRRKKAAREQRIAAYRKSPASRLLRLNS